MISEAGGAKSSAVLPVSSVYCTGNTEIQFDTRMKTKIVTASGKTNGAIFMPMADSTWLRN
ncbi:Uncharacterised protein [Mycobacteroides abscessus subsp. abscessus]|nr:Uncharacterised protein [Mycobacteroides abscessus subsp. abscessus]